MNGGAKTDEMDYFTDTDTNENQKALPGLQNALWIANTHKREALSGALFTSGNSILGVEPRRSTQQACDLGQSQPACPQSCGHVMQKALPVISTAMSFSPASSISSTVGAPQNDALAPRQKLQALEIVLSHQRLRRLVHKLCVKWPLYRSPQPSTGRSYLHKCDSDTERAWASKRAENPVGARKSCRIEMSSSVQSGERADEFLARQRLSAVHRQAPRTGPGRARRRQFCPRR